MISLIQLQYIVAVDTYRHFATAAEKCYITQPTLSMQIKKLEEELGVKVFDRSKQPVIPTDIGTKIIQQARIILNETHKIDDIISTYTDKVAGELRIGIIPTLASTLLPLFIGEFARIYPEVNLKVTEQQTAVLVEQLKQEVIDVAIAVTPIQDDEIKERPIFYEEIKVYTHPEHQIFASKEVPLKTLSEPGMWLLSQGHCFRDQVLNLCSMQEQADGNSPFEYTSGSLDTLKKLVDVEGGFTLLPDLFLDDLPQEQQDRIKKIANYRPVREVSLIYTRNFAKQKLLDTLHQHITTYIPNKMLKADGNVVEWK
ncbi:MAG: LysR substrate-binding domain-containing protein [Flammeovirgaceae bacterium]